MPFYLVAFEHNGAHVECGVQTTPGADPIALAVQKIWGTHCSWSPVPGSATEGRIYERLGKGPRTHDSTPHTGPATVQVTLIA